MFFQNNSSNLQAGFTAETRSQSAYNCENQDFIRRDIVLVSEQDIINTYPQDEQASCAKYAEYQKLILENLSLGYKRCAKLLGVPAGRMRWWHTKGAKKAVPLALKNIEKLKGAGLLPFTEHHKHAKIVLNILGTLFGDGGIDRRLNTVAFISSDKRDVDLWLSDLLGIFSFAKGKTQIVEGGEYGNSYNVRCYDRAVVRFFVALGAPIGNKTSIKYTLPNYISDLQTGLKVSFLDGLLASEVSVVRYRADSFGHMRFTDFSLGLSKAEHLENEHRAFLVNLENLLESVGISTTGNIHKNISAGCLRKDGSISASYRIFIRTTFWRVLHFNELFPLRYCQGKKERFHSVIKSALEHRRQKFENRICP